MPESPWNWRLTPLIFIEIIDPLPCSRTARTGWSYVDVRLAWISLRGHGSRCIKPYDPKLRAKGMAATSFGVESFGCGTGFRGT